MEATQSFISKVYKASKKLKGGREEEMDTVKGNETSQIEEPEGNTSFDWKSIFRSSPTTGINSGEAICEYFSHSEYFNFNKTKNTGRRYSMGSHSVPRKRSPSVISLTTTSYPNLLPCFKPYSFIDETDQDDLLYSGMDMYSERFAFTNEPHSSDNIELSKHSSSPPFKRSQTEPYKKLNLEDGFSLDPPDVLLKDRTTEEKVLSQTMANKLNEKLPILLRLAKSWTLLYSIDQHGLSISTLFRKAEETGPCILVIKDSENQIFGAFLSEALHPNPNYYGTGECFLWRFGNPREIAPSRDDSHLFVFEWTGKNHYTILCEPTYISVGGSDGKYGLWIDSDLNLGISSKCSTFDNLPLAGPQEEFNCVELELWAIDI